MLYVDLLDMEIFAQLYLLATLQRAPKDILGHAVAKEYMYIGVIEIIESVLK